MANFKSVSLTAPNDYATQQKSIDRQRKLAEMLQQESLTPSEGQMVSGWYVPPSGFQHASKLAQALISAYQNKSLDDKQSELTKSAQEDRMNTLTKYASLLRGQEERPAEYGEMQPSPSMPLGSGMFGIDSDINQSVGGDKIGAALTNMQQTSPAQEAIAPDRRAAIAELLKSQDPTLQQFGMQQMLADTKPTNNFNKVDPKDYTQESVARFTQSGNYADLVPVRKREFVNGQAVDPYAVTVGEKIAPQTNPASDLLVPDGKGGFVPNTPLVQVKKDIAGAGRPSVSLAVNTEKNMLGNIAEVVGKDVAAASEKARAAVGTINTVNQIRDAINSGNVIAGPGTSARVFLGQIGQVIGVSGKDDTEKLTNTRQAIQGLAQLELDGAQQMKGQGQITEGERDIVRRAASGDIDKLTVPEMNTLMNTLEKTSRFKIAMNRQNVERLRRNKNADPVVDFLNVDEPPAYIQRAPVPSAPATPANNGGWSMTIIPPGR